jgi:hypothetical protein
MEVSCGPDECQVCTGFHDKPPYDTPSAPLGCYVISFIPIEDNAFFHSIAILVFKYTEMFLAQEFTVSMIWFFP